MKRTLLLQPLVIAAALAAFAPGASAADACKDVTFKFKNEHEEERKIKVVKVRYTNPHNNNKEQTEGVKNIECAHGSTCTTKGDNLGNANQVDIKNIKLVFRLWQTDETWSKEFEAPAYNPSSYDPKCTKGKQYGTISVTKGSLD